MKKLMVLACVLILALATVGCSTEQEEGVGTKEQEDVGTYEGVVSWNVLNLEDRTGAHNLVIDDKLAAVIGNAVLRHIYGDEFIEKTTFSVYELEGKDMFVVSRRKKGHKGAGGSYDIAINKKDGAILKVWMTE